MALSSQPDRSRLRYGNFHKGKGRYLKAGGNVMKKNVLILFSLLLASTWWVAPLQAETTGSPAGNREIMRMGLYPPDVLMRHQQALGINDAQRKRIAALVRDFQSEIADLQWTLQNDQQIFKQSLAEHPVPDDTLAQGEKVLALESQFKLAHFKLLIAIKNELTPGQVAQIDETLKRRRKNGKL